ncbi:MAG: hypothetical protein ACYTFW_09160 [Planctomycetota bacterium]
MAYKLVLSKTCTEQGRSVEGIAGQVEGTKYNLLLKLSWDDYNYISVHCEDKL